MDTLPEIVIETINLIKEEISNILYVEGWYRLSDERLIQIINPYNNRHLDGSENQLIFGFGGAYYCIPWIHRGPNDPKVFYHDAHEVDPHRKVIVEWRKTN